MRSWLPCARDGSPAAAARFGGFFSGTTSASKKTLRAAEQERADIARARRRWMRDQRMFEPARLVFSDETATSSNMVRVRGRCGRGTGLIGHVAHGHWKTLTFVVGLRRGRTVVRFLSDGGTS